MLLRFAFVTSHTFGLCVLIGVCRVAHICLCPALPLPSEPAAYYDISENKEALQNWPGLRLHLTGKLGWLRRQPDTAQKYTQEHTGVE